MPSAFRMACDSGSGVRITSPPRTLNSQAIEAGAVITAASAPSAATEAPDAGALGAGLFTGVFERLRNDRGHGLRRARRTPGLIDGIGLDGLEHRACAGCGGL